MVFTTVSDAQVEFEVNDYSLFYYAEFSLFAEVAPSASSLSLPVHVSFVVSLDVNLGEVVRFSQTGKG